MAAVHDRHAESTCTLCFTSLEGKSGKRNKACVTCDDCGGARYCSAACREVGHGRVGVG